METSRPRRGRRRAAVLALAATAALGLGSFGTLSALGAAPAKPVKIENYKFLPGTLRVKAGSKVAFQNKSSVTHTATDSGSFDTGQIAPGKTKTVTLKKKGTYLFHCTIHPFMKGKIVVE